MARTHSSPELERASDIRHSCDQRQSRTLPPPRHLLATEEPQELVPHVDGSLRRVVLLGRDRVGRGRRLSGPALGGDHGRRQSRGLNGGDRGRRHSGGLGRGDLIFILAN